MTLIAKPFFTIFGMGTICEQIERRCMPSLAMEPTDWNRSGGSEFKTVHVDIDCQRFDISHFSQYGDALLNSPLFHLFVFRENEKLYNEANKELFGRWIGTIRSRSLKNWNILILPNDDQSKNKFYIQKFSVINRLKTDFNLQNIENSMGPVPDSCTLRLTDEVDIIDEIQKFLRNATLHYYDKKCYRNEERIRNQRECMYSQHWNYFDYFVLQEESADVYECLSLFDEALAQFEETNCVFSKCIYNFRKDNAPWIQELRNVPFNQIDSLILTNFSDPNKRKSLANKTMSLADFRAYLLSRQCALLQMLNRYKEIPSKVYDTLLEYLAECKLLNLNIDNNLKNCWIYLTSMQALQRFNAVDCEPVVAQSYASLLRLALSGINELADNLNIWIVGDIEWKIVNNLRDNIVVLNNDEFGDTPSSQLSVALRSCKDFRKFHVKLCEETIMIWKFVGRIRSANLLGTQMADLFFNIKEYEKAEPLYTKAIKCLRNENWAHVAMPLRLKLAICQKNQFETNPENDDKWKILNKYLKTCVHLAGATFSSDKSSFNPDLSLKNKSEHWNYYQELQKCLKIMYDRLKTPQLFQLEPLFQLKSVDLVPLTDGDKGYQKIKLTIESYLPESIKVKLSVRAVPHHTVDLVLHQSKEDEIELDDIDNDEFTECPIDSIEASMKSCSLNNTHKGGRRIHMSTSMDNPNIMAQRQDSEVCVKRRGKRNSSAGVSLVCHPKLDAGLNSRKMSLSYDTSLIFSSRFNARLQGSEDIIYETNDTDAEYVSNSENETRFVSSDNKDTVLSVGENSVILTLNKPGFYMPDVIDITMFNGTGICREILDENKLDSNWTNEDLLNELLPNFIYQNDDQLACVNFTNTVKPNIRMGRLAMPSDDLSVQIDVIHANEIEENKNQFVINNSERSHKFEPNTVYELEGQLCYQLYSIDDIVIIKIRGVIQRHLLVVKNVCLDISQSIIPMPNGKYIVSVTLQRPLSNAGDRLINRNNQALTESKCFCTYNIKQTTLKLHHKSDVVQLLNLMHKSMASAKFCDNSNLVLLWKLEGSDVVNNDDYQLNFTLDLDLILHKSVDSKSEPTILNGQFRHCFTLEYLANY